MKEVKPLILINQQENEFFPNKLDCCQIRNLYKSNRKIYRVYRKVIMKMNLTFLERRIFSNWLEEIDKANYILIFDTGNASYIVRLINHLFQNKRVIVWYWNSVEKSIPISKFKNLNVELWSFDTCDCEKYNLKFNTQFYIKENFDTSIDLQLLTDVFYVGVDKDRSKLLLPLKEIFEGAGISYDFNLVKYRDSISSFIPYKEPLKYREVVNKVCSSKCVVDLTASWQAGLTLRPLEALYNKKKLITNMKNIVNYDIYNHNNIFILGVDNIEDVIDFINSEYDMSNWKALCNKYSFDSWLSRFNTTQSTCFTNCNINLIDR